MNTPTHLLIIVPSTNIYKKYNMSSPISQEFLLWFKATSIELLLACISKNENNAHIKQNPNPTTCFIDNTLEDFQSFVLLAYNQQKDKLIHPKTILNSSPPLKNKLNLPKDPTTTKRVSAIFNSPQAAFIDLETDGLDVNTCNILSIAIVKPTPNAENPYEVWSTYIKPHPFYTEDDNDAFEINNIGNADLEQGKSFQSVAHTIYAKLYRTILSGYNIHKFDLPILKRHMEKADYYLPYETSVDLYPSIWKNTRQNLETSLQLFDLPIKNLHTAEGDAVSCLLLLNAVYDTDILPKTFDDVQMLLKSKDNHWRNTKLVDINPHFHIAKNYPRISESKALIQE
jgi:uncharacterized protein YprB with RNaseH-like and TPR domain